MLRGLFEQPFIRPRPARVVTRRARVLWTLGNSLLLAGVVLFLYVGGLYAQAEYGRFAARGDNDEPAPQAVVVVPAADADAPTLSAEPAPFVPAILNTQSIADSQGRVVSEVPDAAPVTRSPEVTRIVIPAIDLDSKVVPVGWDVVKEKGATYAVWQVAEYAVGHHQGSANPGDHGNIVLAGHVGGYGKVFKDLINLQPGDQITLYSGEQQYLYVVQEQHVVTEEGVSKEVQAENAQYIAPSDHEMITMVTCWPPTGKKRFTQRVIVRALPFGPTATDVFQSVSNWHIR